MKLLQNIKSGKKGFTLIEVVIVLAIAALILVIVFLAVAGAQRSQRDNASQQTAGRAVAAAQSYLSDNNNTFTYGDSATANCNLDGNAVAGCKMAGYFTNVGGNPTSVKYFGLVYPTDAKTMYVGVGVKCDPTTQQFVSAGSTSVAVVYWSESGNKSVCKGS